MRLEKRQQRELTVLGIIFIVFNILVFVLPFHMTSAFWIAYVFDLIAIFAQFPILCVAFKRGKDVKSRFYGFPIARIGVTYLCVQLAFSFVVMVLWLWIPIKLVVILFVLILATAAVGLIATDTTRDEIERQDIQLHEKVSTMKMLKSKAAYIVGQCEDTETKELLQKLSEQLRFSDPVSSKHLTDIEADLTACIDELQNAIIEKDYLNIEALCERAMSILAERNRLCKLNK